MPKTPQEQMAMTPEVYDFTRKFGRGQQVQEKPSVIQQIAGTLGNVALAGAGIAGAYGLARSLGPETNISPVSTGAMSDVGETPTRVGQKGFVRHEQLPEDGRNFGNKKTDPAIEAKYSITRNEAPLHLANRFEKMANIGEAQADLAYEESGQAALDQAFEDAVARDDYHEERFGLLGSSRSTALAEGPETVIEPTKSTTGFLNEFSKEVQDFDHNIPWKERTEEALESDSALEAAKIITKTVAEKGFKDVGTRAKKIVRQVPKTIEKVKEGIQEAANVITHEQIKASTFAEAARRQAGLPPLLGSDVVEVGIESDLSDNAQFDDPHQTNEQISPAGLNRQDTTQTVIDLSNTLSKGLAHLSPEDRMDLARKMIEGGYNS